MRICWKGFLAKNHSWSIVGQNISRCLINMGHHVDLFSTNGDSFFPKDLRKNLIGYTEENELKIIGNNLDKDYDCQISYTSMKNFPAYLSNGNKNRFGIWCYEWAGKNVLPSGFAKHYKSCDFLCAPSNFAKHGFMDSGIPESNIIVIPHGIDIKNYTKNSQINLKTNKKFKILVNVAQNHIRKNIPGILEAYGKAFNKNDDVCLILKAKDKPIKYKFEVSLSSCLKNFNLKYPNHGEIKLLSEFIDDMSDLYRSVDVLFSMSFCEAFLMPSLESIAAGKLVIAPNWGGQIDFLNESNSLLVSGKETKANPNSMYWESKPNALWFEPNIDDAVDKLRYAYDNFEKLNKQVDLEKNEIHAKYDWNNIAKQFLNLCLIK